MVLICCLLNALDENPIPVCLTFVLTESLWWLLAQNEIADLWPNAAMEPVACIVKQFSEVFAFLSIPFLLTG